MNGLLSLVLRRMRGRFWKWLRLVKQPKYLVGFVIFGLYYGWLLFGHAFSGGRHGPSPFEHFGSFGPEMLESVRLLVALGIAALLSIGFLLPSRQPLPFDEAEIQYLFTAPIPRRMLIRYALFKYLPGLLVGSFISVMVFGRGDLLARAARWPALWAVFTAWFLWANAHGLWRARLDEVPARQAWRRRAAAWTALTAYWLAVILLARHAWLDGAGSIVKTGSPQAFLSQFGEILNRQHALRALALPFELPLWTLLATSAVERVIGWLVMTCILVGLTEWCARSPVAFEDGAIERARRASEIRMRGISSLRRAQSPKARGRRPFELGPTGAPEIGIVWKNIMMVGRIPLRVAITWGMLALVAIMALTVPLGAPAPVVSVEMILGAIFGSIFPIAAGQSWRNDLRVDLLHVDQLRTWPIPPHRLIAAEVAAPAVATFLVAMWALGLGLVGAMSGSLARLVGLGAGDVLLAPAAKLGASVPGLALAIFLAAIPLVVALACLSCTLQNVGVLLFPGWTRLGGRRAPGPAAFGQQILLGVGRLVAMIVGLVPGVVVVAALAFGQRALQVRFSVWELPIASVILAAPLLAEAFVLVAASGRLWQRMDPSRELLEGQAA